MLQILLQAETLLVDVLGVLLTDIPIMPRLIHDSSDIRLVRRICLLYTSDAADE